MTRGRIKIMTEKKAAEQIAADPRPLMFVDTCNLGNIVGLACSGQSKIIINTLNCLREGIEHKSFHLIVAHQVYVEFTRPGQFVDAPLSKLEEAIKYWNATVRTYNDIRSDYYHLPEAATSYRPFDIECAKQLYNELVDIGKGFLYKAIIVEASARAKKWAYQRQCERKRPAHEGKESFGDCEICGTALSFLKRLREQQFSEDAYFVSENKRDFAYSGLLHPDLQHDFNEVSLKYCKSIPEAYNQISQKLIISMRGKRVG